MNNKRDTFDFVDIPLTHGDVAFFRSNPQRFLRLRAATPAECEAAPGEVEDGCVLGAVVVRTPHGCFPFFFGTRPEDIAADSEEFCARLLDYAAGSHPDFSAAIRFVISGRPAGSLQ